jgi:nucleotide-binding universal stress UspA family protein
MNTILVPIDFSGVSTAVVNEAARLARYVKGRIILLHVVQPPFVALDFGLTFENIAEYVVKAEKGADLPLSKLCVKLRARGLSAKAVRATGYPATSILEQANKRSANYIVIGSHGHTAFYDLLVGSTTSGVLKRATCPVVIVPSAKKARH